MFISFDQLPYPSSFTVQGPANPIHRPASPSSYNTIDSRPALNSIGPASTPYDSLVLTSAPDLDDSSYRLYSHVAAPPESTASTSISLSSVGRNLFPQNTSHTPTAPMSTLNNSAHDSPHQQAEKIDDEPRAASTCVRTRPQEQGPPTNRRRDVLPYFIGFPREQEQSIAALLPVKRSIRRKRGIKRKRSMNDTGLRTTDRDRQ
jgi:hypothetical protein